MVYVCQAPGVPGKFDNAKATALKVPFGPIRGKLVRGETIEVDDPANPGQKKVVKPEDVIGGGSEGAVSFEMPTDRPKLTLGDDHGELLRGDAAVIAADGRARSISDAYARDGAKAGLCGRTPRLQGSLG